MFTSYPRRKILLSMVALPMTAGLLAACSEAETDEPEADGGSNPNLPESQGSVDMDNLLREGALPDKVLGEAEAPVTIVEYASMTCSHCASFHNNTLPGIKENYIDTGKARLILREFPFDPRAEAGFMLARCADDKYFAMVDVLFQQQRQWAPAEDGRDAMLQIARMAGFSQESFEACLTDQQLLEDVRAVKDRGEGEFEVRATPTFFINGSKYSGDMSVDAMSAIIESKL